MAVRFFAIHNMEKHELGVIEEGEVIDISDPGFPGWVDLERSMRLTPDFNDDDALIRTYDGPFFVAVPVEVGSRRDDDV